MSPISKALCVALSQINFKVGDVEGNTDRILEAMHRARSEGADLVVFSEVAILGYPPRDIVHRRAMVGLQLQALERIAAHTDDDFAVVLGYIDEHPHEGGHHLINGAAFCRSGVIHRKVAKKLLPTYDVFEEKRYFAPAPSQAVVNWKGVNLGFSICEDAWAGVRHWEMPRYTEDPIKELVDGGARLILNLSASPFSINKGDFRRDLLAEHCRRHSRALLFVNQIGGNDELIFDGRSLAIDHTGEVRARLAEFAEDFQLIDVDNQGTVEPRDEKPIRPVATSRAAQARDAVVLGIGDYIRKSNFTGALLGLSGGIDSSVSAVLAADALGAENIHGVAMPSRYSSSHSREDARALGNNLGITFDEIAIEQPFQSMLDVLTPHFRGKEEDVTEENLQARIRGVYLMALSNKHGKLVLACGNKSELAVGYTTLYGDMCGALAVIGDLPKMLVYEIARLYNEEAGRDLIPRRVLEKAPSAELSPDQKDQDSLPPYEVLDAVIDLYVVEHRTIEEIVAAGFDEAMVRQMVGLIHRNEYKRWQAPPILKVTQKAFGVGWRYPLAASYKR